MTNFYMLMTCLCQHFIQKLFYLKIHINSWSDNSEIGGLLQGTSGQVATPNYPRSYPHDADIIWVIQAPTNMYIRITFRDIDIEDWLGECDYDYVMVTRVSQTSHQDLSQFHMLL